MATQPLSLPQCPEHTTADLMIQLEYPYTPLLKAAPDSALWHKVRPSGAHPWAPSTGLAPGQGPGNPTLGIFVL